jgi:RNA polymerase sigma-70 factor (ECF subfamily)
MTHSPPTVASLPPTFGELYHAEFGFVFNLVRRFGGREADLEDLTHDVFMGAWRSRASYDASRPLRPWLMGISFRVVSDYLGRVRNRVEVVAPEEAQAVPDHSKGPFEQTEARQAQDLVQSALSRIETVRRAVFVLHELEDMPISEVARVLEVPEGTAWSRLRTARREFSAAVQSLEQRGML